MRQTTRKLGREGGVVVSAARARARAPPLPPPTHEISALMNLPYVNTEPLSVNESVSNALSLPPKMAEMRGVMNEVTIASISLVNAAPTTKATARSTTLPQMMKSRKPPHAAVGH